MAIIYLLITCAFFLLTYGLLALSENVKGDDA